MVYVHGHGFQTVSLFPIATRTSTVTLLGHPSFLLQSHFVCLCPHRTRRCFGAPMLSFSWIAVAVAIVLQDALQCGSQEVGVWTQHAVNGRAITGTRSVLVTVLVPIGPAPRIRIRSRKDTWPQRNRNVLFGYLREQDTISIRRNRIRFWNGIQFSRRNQ